MPKFPSDGVEDGDRVGGPSSTDRNSSDSVLGGGPTFPSGVVGMGVQLLRETYQIMSFPGSYPNPL